jgi:hypothetical protein
MEEDVKEIVKIAKQILTQFGSHAPMLFVRGSKSSGMITFKDFGPDHEDKVRQMANAGVDAAMRFHAGDLRYVIFVTEAWMSLAEKGKPYIQPSKNPKRKEMLIITTLDVVTNKQGLLMYQMIRDKRGYLIELNKFTEEWDSVKSPLLPAFVAGYNLIKR